MLPLALATALAAAPGPIHANLTWARGLAWVDLAAPAGWHVAPEAPSSLLAGSLTVEGRGDLSGLRFPVAAGPLEADLRFAVCEDQGRTCVPVHVVAAGTITGAKGQFAFAPPVEAASAVLLATDGPRIYDFTAVWCPPCNLLAAEILHDPAERAFFGPFVVVPVDVDRSESWALKDRYRVGGYPTLVAVDTSGAELARLVGYPGEEPTRAWLGSILQSTPLHQLVSGAVTGSPAERAANARRLAEGEYDAEARRWLTGADDGVDAHIARLVLDARPEDAEWLFANAPAGPWLLAALEVIPERWPLAVPMIAGLPAVDAADALAAVADIVGGEAGRALRSAAIASLRATLTGVPDHDRAHVTFLADLYQHIGAPDVGLALLDDYALLFPDEFTFDYAATRLLLDEGRYPQAESRGRLALAKAWGDQRLRAVQPLAKAVAQQGRLDEAVHLLSDELGRAPVPAEGVDVRTNRYRAQVDTLRRELPANLPPSVLPPPR